MIFGVSYTARHRRAASGTRAGRWSTRAGIASFVVATAVVLSAGGALAYWSTAGQGTGNATTGTLTLSAAAGDVSGLYPGASVPASVTVTNDSSAAAVVVQSVSGGTATVTTAGKGTCDASVVTFVATTSLPSSPVAAGATFTVNGNAKMAATAADGCQGAIFSIPVTAEAQAG